MEFYLEPTFLQIGYPLEDVLLGWTFISSPTFLHIGYPVGNWRSTFFQVGLSSGIRRSPRVGVGYVVYPQLMYGRLENIGVARSVNLKLVGAGTRRHIAWVVIASTLTRIVTDTCTRGR